VKKFLEWGLILVIVGSVLAFGGVQPLVYSLMEVCVFLLVFVVLIAQARRGKVDLPIPLAMLPIILLVLLQAAPLPPQLAAWCSPTRLLPTPYTAQPQGGPGWITLSIYPYQTLEALAKLLAYCGAFVLSALVFDSQKRTSALVQALILLGCFEAAYGIIQYLTGYQNIFTYTKRFYTEDATGTYINRNHFAGFLELVIPLVLAGVFYLFQTGASRSAKEARHRTGLRSGALRSEIAVYAFMVVVMLVAAVFSRSRMGILSIFLSLIFVSLLGQVKARRRIWMVGVLVVLGCSLAYALWIGLDPVLRRYELFEQRGYVETEGRLPLWRSGIHLIRNWPVFGTGLGTFGVAFRRYQNVILERFADHAHNDYLEFTAELGIVGIVLLFVPILWLWGRMIRAFLSEPGRYRGSVLLGCVGSIFAILCHTVTDFNLHIPANALVFAVILGIGYKAASESKAASATAKAGIPSGGNRNRD
jgi:O-antigen ligase